MGNRRTARELALQILYQIELAGEEPDRGLDIFWEEHPIDAQVRRYAGELIRGTRGGLETIDAFLSKYARNWVLDRMALVDRNILRMAVFEMFISRGAPPVVVINEAVDIAKKYSTPDSGSFVNGILDRIRKEEMGDVR